MKVVYYQKELVAYEAWLEDGVLTVDYESSETVEVTDTAVETIEGVTITEWREEL